MPFIDVRNQATGEPLPGWHDRYFASQSNRPNAGEDREAQKSG